MLSDLGIRVSKADVRKLFLEADLDGGGYIDFDEFIAIFKKADAGGDSIWQQVASRMPHDHCRGLGFTLTPWYNGASQKDLSVLVTWTASDSSTDCIRDTL